MNNNKIKSQNGLDKGELQSRSYPEELANLFLRAAEERRYIGKSFDIDKTLGFINSCIKLHAKYLLENDVRNLMDTTVLLAHAYYNFGIAEPLYLKWARSRGSHAKKERKAIYGAIITVLPKLRRPSPRTAWQFFETNHTLEKPLIVGEHKIYSVPDCSADCSDGLLIQQHGSKISSVKYKTFEKYYYRIIKESQTTHQLPHQ